MILQNRNIQPFDRILREKGFFCGQQIPASMQIHTEGAFFFGRYGVLLHIANGKAGITDSLKEFFISTAIQILYYTVIRQDLKLIIREKNRKETVEFFLSGVAFLFFPAL